MHWENLTSDEFTQAVGKTGGVCLLPLSCIERHGHHLPLGTDMFIGHELCQRVAELEPVMVFPDFFYTQILEARHVPGTIGIQPEFIIHLLENVCEEIARNGFKKIVIVNTHGGNDNLIRYFAQIQLASPRDYVVYVAQPPYQAEQPATTAQWETEIDDHAGERETSMILAIRPELVKLETLPEDGEGMPMGRLKSLNDTGTYTGIWWYADNPTHYCGDGHPGTAIKGEVWFTDRTTALVKTVRAVKVDKEAKRLQDEFFGKIG